ncbi:MAG TPA: hypothetical protein VET84_07785 [Stellaceae bacterium]|nr:hypothetical protein [Stellaceae bacterium]
MRKNPILRAFALAALLAAPLTQAALADDANPQLCQGSSAAPSFLFNGAGPYDAPSPTVG